MNPDFVNLPLRDPHLPEPISWWPPAPGWWVLMLLVIMMSMLCIWLFSHIRGNRVKRDALMALDRLEATYHSGADKHKTVASISILMRRINLSLYPRDKVASLTGERWLAFLDEGFDDKAQAGGFSQGVGRAIIEAPYNPAHEVDLTALFALTRRWIAQAGKPKSLKKSILQEETRAV